MLGLKSVSTLWSGAGGGVLVILTGKQKCMGMQAFLPFLQGSALSSQLQGSRPASCCRITQQPQLEHLLEHL